MSLRILHVSDFYLPRAGGIERVMQGLAREQLRSGNRPEVLTRRLEPAQAAREDLDGVAVHRVGRGPRAALVHYPEVVYAVRRWAAHELERFDLVHCHLTLTSLGLLREAQSRGLPVVATFYGPWHREYLVEVGRQGLKPRGPAPVGDLNRQLMAGVMRAAQAHVLDRARQILVLSRHSASELGEFGYGWPSSRIHLVPGGVDTERFQPGASVVGGAGPLVLTVRRLVPRMGIEVLLGAFARIKDRWPDAELLVAGEGPLRPRLEAQAAEAGGVRLLGRVPDGELAELYGRADLVVMPTRALEGFGLPVLEAWASGAPVVGTPVGSLPELLGRADERFVAAGSDAEAIAAAMLWALGQGRARWAGVVRELALEYSWSAIAERTGRVYEGALVGLRASASRN